MCSACSIRNDLLQRRLSLSVCVCVLIRALGFNGFDAWSRAAVRLRILCTPECRSYVTRNTRTTRAKFACSRKFQDVRVLALPFERFFPFFVAKRVTGGFSTTHFRLLFTIAFGSCENDTGIVELFMTAMGSNCLCGFKLDICGGSYSVVTGELYISKKSVGKRNALRCATRITFTPV